MYGYPNIYPVMSLSALLEVVKNFQLVKPLWKIALCLKGKKMKVGILTNGYIVLNDEVPTLAVEREIDDAIKQYGAAIEITNQQVGSDIYTEHLDVRAD